MNSLPAAQVLLRMALPVVFGGVPVEGAQASDPPAGTLELRLDPQGIWDCANQTFPYCNGMAGIHGA